MTIALVVAAVALLALVVAVLLVRGGSPHPIVGDFNQQALTRVIERHERDQVGRD